MKLKKYFSKKCYLLVFAIFLFIMTGYFHSNNIAYLIGFFLMAFLFAFAILGYLNIKKVDFEVIFPKRIFANTPFNLTLKFKDKVYDILIGNNYFKIAKGLEEIPFIIKKRGYFDLKSLKVVSFFPICNVFVKEVNVNKKVIVYPEIRGVSLKEFLFSKVKGSDEFDELKSYEGEGINLIHWPSVAKGEVLAKRFYSLNKKELVFDYSKIEGDKEFRLSQLTKWVLEAEKLGLKYRVILDKEIRGNTDEILQQIALY